MVDIVDIKGWAVGLLPSANTVMSVLKWIILGVCTLVILGLMLWAYYAYTNKKKTNTNIELAWWRDDGTNMTPTTQVDKAEEIFVPQANLRLFYVPDKNAYFPRFTREIAPNRFYLALTPHKQVVNFSLKSIGKDMSEAGLNYDHTDNAWAAENMREFVKRNYTDKSIPWYIHYQGVITSVVYIVTTTVCLGVILWLWKGIVDQQLVASNMIGEQCKEFARLAIENKPSGVIQVK